MTSLKEAMAAPGVAQQQRFKLKGLLEINRASAAPPDIALAEKVLAAATPEDYDTLLASLEVQSLFARSVLFVRTGRQP